MEIIHIFSPLSFIAIRRRDRDTAVMPCFACQHSTPVYLHCLYETMVTPCRPPTHTQEQLILILRPIYSPVRNTSRPSSPFSLFQLITRAATWPRLFSLQIRVVLTHAHTHTVASTMMMMMMMIALPEQNISGFLQPTRLGKHVPRLLVTPHYFFQQVDVLI